MSRNRHVRILPLFKCSRLGAESAVRPAATASDGFWWSRDFSTGTLHLRSTFFNLLPHFVQVDGVSSLAPTLSLALIMFLVVSASRVHPAHPPRRSEHNRIDILYIVHTAIDLRLIQDGYPVRCLNAGSYGLLDTGKRPHTGNTKFLPNRLTDSNSFQSKTLSDHLTESSPSRAFHG